MSSPSEQLASLKSAARNLKARSEAAEQGVARKAMMGIVGAGHAYAEKKGAPVAILGVPTKLAVTTAFTIAELMTKGSTQRVAGAIADSSFAVYSYASVKKGAFVAGADDDNDDDDTEVSGGNV